jgi:hypothetical protein
LLVLIDVTSVGMDEIMSGQARQTNPAGNAGLLGTLLLRLQPVIIHLASVAQCSWSAGGDSMAAIAAGACGTTASGGCSIAGGGCAGDPSAFSSHGMHPGSSEACAGREGDQLPNSLTPATENALLSLMAASMSLRNYIKVQPTSGTEPAVPATGLHDAGSSQPATSHVKAQDLVAVLSAVLSLSATLISKGPWWQEAKAKHPLLLLETLGNTSKVCE